MAWSHDNRTAGFRRVGAEPENRMPRPRCRPQSLPHSAAELAAGLDGIARGAEPPPRFEGDAYAPKVLPRVSAHRGSEAAERFAVSEFAQAVFGKDVVQLYAHFFRAGADATDTTVTDWERRRHFERV
jgi:glutamine synthetase